MWAFAVFNRRRSWVEIYSEMPCYDAATEMWTGGKYLCSKVACEMNTEMFLQIREKEPLLISVDIVPAWIASKSDAEQFIKNFPEDLHGNKLNN